MNRSAPLTQGERAPDFVLPVQNGTPTRFYARAGGQPTVLIFTPKVDESIATLIEWLDEHRDPSIATFIVQYQPDIPDTSATVFADAEGEIRSAYRLDETDAPVFFILNSNLRVLSTEMLDGPKNAIENIRTIFQSAHDDSEPREITSQAPVLLIPNVLTPDICQALINVWHTQGHEATGVEQSVQGSRKDILDSANKKRRDHIVTDEKLMRLISTTVGRRVMPEIRKAFHFTATRFEGFKIVCYDAKEEGFFHAHRDNLSPSTAHRRFALTLNLNDGYEGGHLCFPEYGPHLYKPGVGNAILFSCAHLHEVTPVTSGQRFTLLSFLFGEDAIRTSQSDQ